MTQKTMVYIVLILLLGVGFLAGSFLGGFVRNFAVPADHKRIVDDMKIAFTIEAWGVPTSTTPTCVYNKIVTWGVGAKPLSMFTPGEPYGYSIWLWQFQDEVQYAMQIWGPDDTGKSYDIQLMRNYGPPFTVTYKGETIIDKGRISATLQGTVWVYSEALYAFSVTVE